MRQRVVIARALTVDPEMLVADEAVSMIDVSLRLGILALLRTCASGSGVSVLFITHDVATARYIGDDGELYVIYRGRSSSAARWTTVIADPVHPYTQSLLSAIPVLHGSGAARRAAGGAAGAAGPAPGRHRLPVRRALPVPRRAAAPVERPLLQATEGTSRRSTRVSIRRAAA